MKGKIQVHTVTQNQNLAKEKPSLVQVDFFTACLKFIVKVILKASVVHHVIRVKYCKTVSNHVV